MNPSFFDLNSSLGTPELQLPENLREPLREHLENLHQHYVAMQWASRVGFGERPAVVVIDLALTWTQPQTQMGSYIDPVVEATCQILAAARQAQIPIFFSTFDFDPHEHPAFQHKKSQSNLTSEDTALFELDPRLERRPHEKLVRKRSASCFKGTSLKDMLTALQVDTLIVTGVSTSHCVYATCRDGCDAFRIIIPQEAVGERCQIMHWVNLLDMDIDLGDVMPMQEVLAYLNNLPST
jgi:nicotinamidase-related amidase